MSEEMEQAIRKMSRDAEVIGLLKRLSDEGPLSERLLKKWGRQDGCESQEIRKNRKTPQIPPHYGGTTSVEVSFEAPNIKVQDSTLILCKKVEM
jgi:hypothetical protein